MKTDRIRDRLLSEKGDTKEGYSWIVLLIVFIASVSAPVNHFKVPPVMPALISEFGLNMTMAGLLMSLLMFWHHLGEFTGPLYFGEIVDKTSNWETAALFMIPICIIGGVAGLLMKEKI